MFWLLGLLLLDLIVILHEFGHFIMAKLFGVGIVEYSLGMGPIVYTKRKKDTVFSLRLFPVGGYCALYGENSIETNDKGQEDKKLKKHYKFEKSPDFKTDWNENQSYKSKTKLQQFLIAIAGPFANIFTGFLGALAIVIIFGAMQKPVVTGFFADDSPAVMSGIEIGDEILAVDGRKILTYTDYTEYMFTHRCFVQTNGCELTLKRIVDGKETIYTTVAYPDKETNKIGVWISTSFEKKPASEVMKYAWNQTIFWLRSCFDSIVMLIRGDIALNSATGVVGTTVMVGDTLDQAQDTGGDMLVRSFFVFFTMISINLGVMNLLPIPALDGGRALIVAFEGLFRKNLPQKIEYGLNFASFCFLMFLMIYTFVNDFIKLFTGGFE